MKVTVPVTADTNVQTWNAETSLNLGDNEHLRVLNFNDAAQGALGQTYAGNQTGKDAKLSYLRFDLTDAADDLQSMTLSSAELSMTYFGPTKGALTGTNVLNVALAAPGWTEGNGKSTAPTRTNTNAGAMTWASRAAVDTNAIAVSQPFSVVSPAKVGSDTTYSATQNPIGSVAVTDVTGLVSSAAGQDEIAFAVNETKKQDLIFVSREGAARNPAAAGMAPSLTLTFSRPAPALETAALAVAVAEADKKDITAYTADSWEAFQQSAAAARSVLAAPESQAQIDQTALSLEKAASELASAAVSITAAAIAETTRVGTTFDDAVTVQATYADATVAELRVTDLVVQNFGSTAPGDRKVDVAVRPGLAPTGTTPATSSLTLSVLSAWNSAAVYRAGDLVEVEGTTWKATWWTSGQKPGGSNGAWQQMRTASDGAAVWTPSRIFTAGEAVVHNGQRYEAKWWTRNQTPGDANGPWRKV